MTSRRRRITSGSVALLATTLGSSSASGAATGKNTDLQSLDQIVTECRLAVNCTFLDRTCAELDL